MSANAAALAAVGPTSLRLRQATRAECGPLSRLLLGHRAEILTRLRMVRCGISAPAKEARCSAVLFEDL
jgi:hypothetical protein